MWCLESTNYLGRKVLYLTINKRSILCLLAVLCCCQIRLYSQGENLPVFFPGTSLLYNQYGITSHITWYGYDYDDYHHNICRIAALGNNVIRLDFNSPGIGWETGRVNYSIWDNVYYTSRKQGVKMLPIVYKPRYKKYTKEYGDSYKSLLKTCLSRYGDNVVGWEIWNEMDQMNAEDGTAPPPEYLPLLKDAYAAIKGQGNNNVVLMGAIGDLSKSYLDELLQKGAAASFDVLSIHYYSAKNPPESIIPFYNKLNSILQKRHVSKPVWLTETGYVSESDNTDADLFYTEVLPKVYKQLGINCSKATLGILYDKRMTKGVWNQDNPNVGYGFKTCELVPMNQLKTLSVETIPVLMVLFGEKFPEGFFEDIRAFVERGGTIVFPEGGAFLYYDWDLDTNEIKGVGSKYYKQLHVGCLFPWEAEAKKRGVTKMQAVRTTPLLASSYSWRSSDFDNPKYLTETNLHNGDVMIPLVEGTDGKNRGAVAACYKLNSELKGNVIIQTRPKLSDRTSESLQASRFPRLYLLSYAMGVDKVFAYCLKDRKDAYGYGITHLDMTLKPAAYTLKALSEMLPSGSTRPVVKMKDNQYIASWQKPNGQNVYCVWSSWVGQQSTIAIIGSAKYYNENGKRINKKFFKLSPNVTYIVGAKSVEFEKRLM